MPKEPTYKRWRFYDLVSWTQATGLGIQKKMFVFSLFLDPVKNDFYQDFTLITKFYLNLSKILMLHVKNSHSFYSPFSFTFFQFFLFLIRRMWCASDKYFFSLSNNDSALVQINFNYYILLILNEPKKKYYFMEKQLVDTN